MRGRPGKSSSSAVRFSDANWAMECMFEKTIFRYPETAAGFDKGTLAEALLFYQHVQLVGDPFSILSIQSQVGTDSFLRLIDLGFLSVICTREQYVVRTETRNGISTHWPNGVAFVGHADFPGRRFDNEDLLRFGLVRRYGLHDAEAKILSRKLIGKIKNYNRIGVGEKIIDMMMDDLRDRSYVEYAARSVVSELYPNFDFPRNWSFKLFEEKRGFVSSTNYDFGVLEREAIKAIPHYRLTKEGILQAIVGARADMVFAADHSAELTTDAVTAAVLRTKFGSFISKSDKSSDAVRQFQMNVLTSRAVREAINSNERTFLEFTQLLEKSQKFRDWLKEVDGEKGLVQEYINAITRETWLDKLPSKATRFFVANGIGLTLDALFAGGVATAAALGLEAADAFLLDRFLKGWRPNHFVNNELEGFVGGRKL